MSSGPLSGIRVIELAGVGPAPFAGMLLADLGAEVIRVDRPTVEAGADEAGSELDLLGRGRLGIVIDLKRPEGREVVLRLIERADVLIEGFRPGVAERLGLGPDVCEERNPRLVYGRMTGWGQHGPLATAAGHDLNYIALAGALHLIGPRDGKPAPPLNLIGDFGGGGMYLVVGILAALLERNRSGIGQVVDAAMVDGAASLLTMVYGMFHCGAYVDERGSNIVDGGAPFYDAYETSDGRYIAIAPVESKFYRELVGALNLDTVEFLPQLDSSRWSSRKEQLAKLFATRTRDEWCRVLEGTDVCFAPVLSLSEAPRHPHNIARQTFVEVDGVIQPAPAPRFSRTPGEIARPPCSPGEHTQQVLLDLGFSPEKIERLRQDSIVA